MDEVILQFDHFGFQYNAQSEPTLHDICLSVRRGEKILIAGPSGCGKSTLAHCINGLIPFSYKGVETGRLTIAGANASELGIFGISKHVGTVLQDSDGQFIGLTVAEDIAFALENDCVDEPELHDRVMKAAKMVSIEHHLLHAPGELSGGQKQRVAMAGVMVEDVDILLFDEPLANLDPATGKTAIELIDEIGKSSGAAVIIIEHRLEDVLHRNVDRIILMSNGRILSDSTPDELLSSGLLVENGIREPLYLPALRYAGIEIKKEMHPWSISALQLSDGDKARVRNWFVNSPEPPRKPEPIRLLQVDHIHFSYENGHLALDDISLVINKGEIAAIVGTNGAGKSTLSKVICGFETPQQGSMQLGGNDLSMLSIKERADHIGYVMQNPNHMISQVLIWDEIALGLKKRNVPESEITERVENVLKICGLWPFRKWPISALSYGQKKRVTIASILVLEPEILILDEPTAGQDYRHYTEIMEFLRKLNQQGYTIIMITHDMHLMLEYAERAIVFSAGKIIADDTFAAILTSPEIIQAASLKETSLYDLAMLCGIQDGQQFVSRFIDHEREAYRS